MNPMPDRQMAKDMLKFAGVLCVLGMTLAALIEANKQ